MMDAIWLYVAFCAGSLVGALVIGLLTVARWAEEREAADRGEGPPG